MVSDEVQTEREGWQVKFENLEIWKFGNLGRKGEKRIWKKVSKLC
jgi:hypothetical protein